jgi:DNA repair protein RadC
MTDNEVITQALGILEGRMKTGPVLANNQEAMQYCALKYGNLPYEQLSCLFLNVDKQLVAVKELFHGTLTETPGYPREVMRAAIEANAWGVVLVHNHPGTKQPEPSEGDLRLTKQMGIALKMIDVQLMDHILVAGPKATSMQQFLEQKRSERAQPDEEQDKRELEESGDVEVITDEDSEMKVMGLNRMPMRAKLALLAMLMRYMEQKVNTDDFDEEDKAIAKLIVDKIKEARKLVEEHEATKGLPRDKDGNVDPSQLN